MAAGVGSWTFRFDDGSTEVSSGLRRMLGVVDECPMIDVPSVILGITHPDDTEAVRAGLSHLANAHEPAALTFRILDAEGQLRLLCAETETEVADDGMPVIARTYVRDVTRSTMLERVAQARIRLVELAPSHSLEGILKRTLDEAEALTGSEIGFYHFVDADQVNLTLQAWSTRTENEFCTAIGKGEHYPVAQAGVWADCVYERQPLVHNDYASLPGRKGLPEGHAPVRRELVVPVIRDGRIVAILGVGNKVEPYDDLDVDAVSTLADVAWDVASRKRAEMERAEADAHFRILFETMEQGVIFQDADGTIISANAAAQRILGLTTAQLMGRTSRDPRWRAIHEDGTDFPGEEHPITVALRTGEPIRGTIMGVFNPAENHVRWMSIDATPRYRAGEDTPFEAFVIFTDITEQRRAESGRARRSELLRGLSDATLQLLSHPSLSDGDIVGALAALGVASGAERAYVFEHSECGAGNRGSCSLRFGWTAEQGIASFIDPRTQDLSWDEFAPSWHDALVAGEVIRGDVADFPELERRTLGVHGSATVLEIPIHSGDRLWGFIGFDTSVPAHQWSEYDVELLTRAATSLGTAMQLREQATRDPLTSLYNRRFLDEALDHELARSLRASGSFSVISLDIDEFKVVNDRWGHAAGDRLLREFAETLRAVTRTEDIVCRMGGDEFLVVLLDADAQEATACAERWQQEIRALSCQWTADGEPITASMGVTTSTNAVSREQVLDAADRALLRAKAAGRDRVEIELCDFGGRIG